MNDSHPFDPDALSRVVGPRPRQWKEESSGGRLGRFFKRSLTRDEVNSRAHFENGDPMWGVILQVQDDARQDTPASSINFGLCLVAPNLDPRTALDQLTEIIGRLLEASQSDPSTWDAEQQAFMAGFSDGTMQNAGYFGIPAACHGGVECGLLITRFPQADIPGRSVRKNVVPLMVSWDVPIATVVPASHWPEDFEAFWFASPSQDSVRDQDSPSNGIAFEVAGLPADEVWLNALHDKVAAQAEAAGLACYFVNTGHMMDGDRNPISGTGGLQILGNAAEGDHLLALLHHIIGEECAHLPGLTVTIDEMPLEEFFDAFGHMLGDD